MRILSKIFLLSSLVVPTLFIASHVQASVPTSSNLEHVLDRAISQNLIAGGVIVVGNRDGIISTVARGQLSPAAGAPQLDERSVFDIASLTKVAATTPAVMKLVDDGKINLNDPLSRWFPEFEGKGHTVLHLLTHTSGLNDVSVGSSIESAVRKAAAQHGAPGTRFNYADINFILLGEMVKRVSGASLDQFCMEQIYKPLGFDKTTFLPSPELAAAIAPTSGSKGGVVQDLNARRLGGVAGHAGLFSSAYDLSRYARMILGGGALDNQRILSEQVVAQMTTPYLCNDGRVTRGLGWDITSPYSAPKGKFFSGASFGHTGYSGSSMWIDPQQDLFVIMLTRRTNYNDTRSFNKLRRDVSSVAVADVMLPDEVPALVASLQESGGTGNVTRVAIIAKEGEPIRLIAKGEPAKVKVAKVQYKRSARGERVIAKAKSGSGRRAIHVARVARVAKAETCKTPVASAKKKKRSVKG